MHQRGIFPGTGDLHDIGKGEGEGFTVNVPLPPASGEKAALRAHDEVLLPRAEAFQPDFVRTAAGLLAHIRSLVSHAVALISALAGR
jgi:acetoin utilization deacetylase AcuC-like enzyme